MSSEIPPRYRNLLSAPGIATLSVLGPDRTIQSTLVWPDFDGDCIRLNMLRDSPKERNLRREGRATVLVAERENPDRYVSVRCEVQEFTAAGAIEHLDLITLRNTGRPRWYGELEPVDPALMARRIVVHLRPVRVYST